MLAWQVNRFCGNGKSELIRIAKLIVVVCALQSSAKADDWPQWRGPSGTGSLQLEDSQPGPPTNWSATENVAWKTAIPGRGHSSPVVIGERIFLLTTLPVGDPLPPRMSGRPGEHDNLPVTSKIQFAVLCLSRTDGKLLWQKVVHEAVPVEAGHITASLASATPAAADDRLYAMFGSYGLYCLDFEGKIVWQKEFGQMHTKHGHGEGASPTMSGDTLILNWDHEEQSFIVALNRQDGSQKWRVDRDEDTSWSSPIVALVDGRNQVIVCGTNRVRGYDLESGKVIWECGGLSSNIVATPVYDSATGILVVGSSYEIRRLLALRLPGAQGDITNSERVVWQRSRGTPYVPSLLLAKDGVYFLTHYQNILTRVAIADGKDSPGAMRLGELGNIYASPVSDGRHVFVTDLDGVTMVISATGKPEMITVNNIDEPVSASLALTDHEVFIRGASHLYCIRK